MKKWNMADASGKKNSRQLFSYPYSLWDKLVGWGNQSLLCFLKPSSSLPSVSPSWWAGLFRGRDILVQSSSSLPSHRTPCFFTLHPPPRGHLPLTSFSALFVSPIRLLARCRNLWCAGQLPRSSCDLHSGGSPAPTLFTTCWSSSYQPCPPPRPVRNSFSQFPSFTRLFQDWHTEIEKKHRVSVLSGINPTRTSLGLLLNYDCHFLSPLCSPLRLCLPLPRSYGPSSFNAVLSCWLKQRVIFWMSNNTRQ